MEPLGYDQMRRGQPGTSRTELMILNANGVLGARWLSDLSRLRRSTAFKRTWQMREIALAAHPLPTTTGNLLTGVTAATPGVHRR